MANTIAERGPYTLTGGELKGGIVFSNILDGEGKWVLEIETTNIKLAFAERLMSLMNEGASK